MGSGKLKRFIRYLYEYEQGRRLRNVGFIKVEQGEDDCAVHIHGKGLHMKGEKKLQLYLFYEENDECIGVWQGTVDNVNPAINYRLYYTKEDVGIPANFMKINGMILESENGHKYAAVWDDMPVDVDRMRVWQQKPERVTIVEKLERMAREKDAEEEERAPEEAVIQKERNQPEMHRPVEEQNEQQEQMIMAEQIPMEEEQAVEEQDVKGQCPSCRFQCSKIQRNELARLPRCEWKLANNSFLLHGYYNYHHLALIDDGKGLRLGVPGIYHPQEAKAASAFGFAEFIPIQEIDLELTEDEGDESEQFGYWCRYVKGPRAF